jgi:hypothetical protein
MDKDFGVFRFQEELYYLYINIVGDIFVEYNGFLNKREEE